ncbi:hypothetical protein Y032_0302g1859 [Ancylostoma ceylanicum]|uniref:Uncharacterized protein n=1 Tax=Ancylostoma ceylanicum TaxID=53326 RepID=A0A016S426_9BILA|nr:hypothetical protein Y032_0302g1859 [Ancylostoma ceylanicum]
MAGLLLTFRQIVGAPAPERREPLLEEVLQCLFDVVADFKFLTKEMTLEMGKNVVIRVSQVRGIRSGKMVHLNFISSALAALAMCGRTLS